MNYYIDLVKKILLLGKMQTASKGSHRQLINQHWMHSFKGNYCIKEEEGVDCLIINNFPLLSHRKMAFDKIKGELFWYFTGSSNIEFLHERNIHIWDEFANSFGEVGPTYPVSFNYLGQLDKIASYLKDEKKRYSRRLFADFWLNEYAEFKYPMPHYQPPCIVNVQFLVEKMEKRELLHCIVTQRSCDVMLGLPWDIATYSLLLGMMGLYAGIPLGNIYFNIGSAHIYENHEEEAHRLVKQKAGGPPQLVIKKREDSSTLLSVTYEEQDIQIKNYTPLEDKYNFTLNVGN